MLFVVVANQCIYPLLVIDAIAVQSGMMKTNAMNRILWQHKMVRKRKCEGKIFCFAKYHV